MKQKLSIILPAVLSAALLFAADDPLQRANAYTLELSPEMKPTAHFFPLSILRNDTFEILAPMGFTFTDAGGHCCYEFAKGNPCTYHTKVSDRGPVFVSLWAAHTLAGSRKTKHYGELKNSMSETGKPHRRHDLNLNDARTRRYVLDYQGATVRKIHSVNGDRLFMWHLDNEWELPLDYSPEAKAAFVKFAKKLYNNDLAKFNKVWNADYKSFDDFIAPGLNDYKTRPGAWLDWRRFQEETYTDFMAERFRNVTENDPLKRRVVFKGTQCTLEMPAVARVRVNNHEMLAEKTRGYAQGWYAIDMYGNGDRNAYEYNNFYQNIRPADPADRSRNWGVFAAETNNHAGTGWQFAETFWRSLANGVKGFNFFTLGYFGARHDWATFAFTSAYDGSRTSRFYYASRLGSFIHRTERFWAESMPDSKGGIAMLMAQRDVLLSDPAGASRWDYSQNNRLNVYRHLRSAGYRVDVLSYGKLTPAYLNNYAALVLVGADHLSAAECAAIADYVKNGGVLLADGQTAFFDEHHLIHRGLESVLGIRMGAVYKGIDVSPDDLWYRTDSGDLIRCDGKVLGTPTTAALLNKRELFDNYKAPMLTENRFGKGRAFWFSTRLGVMRAESAPDHIVADWLAGILSAAGVKPQAVADPAVPELRVESPNVDKAGNAVTVIANTVREPVQARRLTVRLPRGDYRYAFWATAETTALSPLSLRNLGNGLYEFHLPEIRTAGAIYTPHTPAPMLGIRIDGITTHPAADRWTAELRPGQSFEVTVQVANPQEGTLELKGYADWTVFPASAAISSGLPGTVAERKFRVTLPRESRHFKPNMVYPLVAYFSQNGKKTAICNAIVTVAPADPLKQEHLLTDAPGSMYRDMHLEAIRTGAEYRIELPGEVWRGPASALAGNGQVRFFRAGKAPVLFDLKHEYGNTRIAVDTPTANSPALSAEFSRDGKQFTPPVSFRKELKITPQTARYVRVTLDFPAKNGIAEEIRIYGRKLKP